MPPSFFSSTHHTRLKPRWPKGYGLVGQGFKSAVQVSSLLAVVLVAYTCHWTLAHSVGCTGVQSRRES